MANINISGNVEKKLCIEFVPYIYTVKLNLKHGQIILIRRQKSPRRRTSIESLKRKLKIKNA